MEIFSSGSCHEMSHSACQEHPPAPRLVGIELNPGPTNAQPLFVDALRSVFAFLNNAEYLHASTRICKDWYAIGGSSQTSYRRLWTIAYHAGLADDLTRGVNSPLRVHLTSLSLAYLVLTQWQAVFTSLPFYPFLHALTLNAPTMSTDLSPILGCSTLTSLTLTSYAHLVVFHLGTAFSVEQFVLQMSQVSIPEAGLVDSRSSTQIQPHEVKAELNGFLTHMRVLSRCANLTYLSINECDDHRIGFLLPLMELHQITLPSIRRFPFRHFLLTEEYVHSLVSVLPQLTEVITSRCASSTLVSALTRLSPSLTTLDLKFDPGAASEDAVLSITNLSQLTHLSLQYGCPPNSSAHWNAIFTNTFENLTSLSFTSTGQRNLLEHLTATEFNRQFCSTRLRQLTLQSTRLNPAHLSLLLQHFSSLRSLELSGSAGVLLPFDSLTFDQLKDAFDDATIMPLLDQLTISVRSTQPRRRPSQLLGFNSGDGKMKEYRKVKVLHPIEELATHITTTSAPTLTTLLISAPSSSDDQVQSLSKRYI